MPGWEESADRPVMAAPVLRPGDVFPPRPPETDRRRRRWPLWIAALVILAMGAGVVIYLAGRKPTPSSADEVAAVRKAYLAWWGARKEAYLKLNPAPMRPYMTDAGFKLESAELAQQQQANEPVDIVVPSHEMQIVVYRGGRFASVDDIWKSENVALDPTTHQPTSKPADDFGEESATLKLVAGKWLVDDKGQFGSSDAIAGTPISYAAVPGDEPPPALRSQIVTAFTKFESVRADAYLRLDQSRLTEVESQPYLGADQQHIGEQVAKNEPIRYLQQDNYRIGIQDANHAWIYDTLLDQSEVLDRATGLPVQGTQTHVYRLAYAMTKGATGWVVANVGGF